MPESRVAGARGRPTDQHHPSRERAQLVGRARTRVPTVARRRARRHGPHLVDDRASLSMASTERTHGSDSGSVGLGRLPVARGGGALLPDADGGSRVSGARRRAHVAAARGAADRSLHLHDGRGSLAQPTVGGATPPRGDLRRRRLARARRRARRHRGRSGRRDVPADEGAGSAADDRGPRHVRAVPRLHDVARHARDASPAARGAVVPDRGGRVVPATVPGRARCGAIPIVGILWANLHGSFVLLPLLCAVAFVGDLVDRDERRWVTGALVAVSRAGTGRDALGRQLLRRTSTGSRRRPSCAR